MGLQQGARRSSGHGWLRQLPIEREVRICRGADRILLRARSRFLPQRLTQAIGMSDAALVVGLIDRIEVWDPGLFNAAVSEKKPEFAGYASQVFA